MIFFFLTGATPRAAYAFPGSELSHLHVCLFVVPHHLPHLLSPACRHKNLWYLHVWGQLKGTTVAAPRGYHLLWMISSVYLHVSVYKEFLSLHICHSVYLACIYSPLFALYRKYSHGSVFDTWDFLLVTNFYLAVILIVCFWGSARVSAKLSEMQIWNLKKGRVNPCMNVKCFHLEVVYVDHIWNTQ